MKRVPRCPWLAAVFCQQSLSWQLSTGAAAETRGRDVSAGLSGTYHTKILQNKIMQTEAKLQPFNVHTLATHLVNVFSLTQMCD